ncbi:glucose 1-dehydrogenase [Verrucomicrobium sp. GAS474]|uniref:SDR family NAD(P)-dependent oxidoreductase n=1 Tax=Verrucomicrobium sp. GAS474 TaxID=1882831 RepID=UPI00087AC6B1|nr:SDR family NAD(P)-dependent oxidoreductase [Verrucomicrobium sp. GAS474]SDT94567.1 glucose 1-dehydrogenase [Verrucomicrobium sp. GAS474]
MNQNPSKTLAENVAVVTGSARGIGLNIARCLGRHGAHVVICDNNSEAALNAVAELAVLGVSCSMMEIDLSRKESPIQLIEGVYKNRGRLDILVNNARAGKRTSMLTETPETWDELFSVSLRAAFFVAQEAIRRMPAHGGGSIINIASVTAMLSSHEAPAYHIAKAGVLQMTRYLAVNAGPSKIRVNAVAPGFIVQDEYQSRYAEDGNAAYRGIAEFAHPLRGVGSADDVAQAVLFLASPQSRFVTGQCLSVDGGSSQVEQWALLHAYDEHRNSILAS